MLQNVGIIFSVIVSLISVFFTYKNKTRELKIARNKIWYEKQTEVIDELVESLENLGRSIASFKIEDNYFLTGDELSEFVTGIVESNKRYTFLINSKKHYFPDDIEKNLYDIHIVFEKVIHHFPSEKQNIDIKSVESDYDNFIKEYNEVIFKIKNRFF